MDHFSTSLGVGVNGHTVASEGELLDEKISKTREEFFMELARRKRAVKRHWLELNAVTNAYFLQLLPYRSLLNQVSRVTYIRKEQMLSPIPTSPLSSFDNSSMDYQTTLPSPSLSDDTEDGELSEAIDDDFVDVPRLLTSTSKSSAGCPGS